nr:hypothetical protein [Planctomycetota bacterium]
MPKPNHSSSTTGHVYSFGSDPKGPLHPLIGILTALRLHVHAGRRSRSGPEHRIRKRRFHLMSLMTVAAGQFAVRLGATRRVLGPGQGALIPAGLEHDAGMQGDAGSVVWADCRLAFWDVVPAEHLLHLPRWLDGAGVTAIQHAIEGLHALSTSGAGTTANAAAVLRHHNTILAELVAASQWRTDSLERGTAALRLGGLVSTVRAGLD